MTFGLINPTAVNGALEFVFFCLVAFCAATAYATTVNRSMKYSVGMSTHLATMVTDLEAALNRIDKKTCRKSSNDSIRIYDKQSLAIEIQFHNKIIKQVFSSKFSFNSCKCLNYSDIPLSRPPSPPSQLIEQFRRQHQPNNSTSHGFRSC